MFYTSPHHQGINLIQSILLHPSKMFFSHKRFSPRIGDLDKKKYLVPSDLTVGQFYFLIRFNNSLWKELSWIVSWISSLIYQEENQPEAGGRPLLLRQQRHPPHLRHHGLVVPGDLLFAHARAPNSSCLCSNRKHQFHPKILETTGTCSWQVTHSHWFGALRHVTQQHKNTGIAILYFHWEVLVSMCFQDIHGIGCIYKYSKSLCGLWFDICIF